MMRDYRGEKDHADDDRKRCKNSSNLSCSDKTTKDSSEDCDSKSGTFLHMSIYGVLFINKKPQLWNKFNTGKV